MYDLIAGIVTVERVGQPLSPAEGLALEEALRQFFERIHGQESVEAADADLTQLGLFQSELARACFKWEIRLPEKLREFVREFDRSDDSRVRVEVFKKIKDGTFLNETA